MNIVILGETIARAKWLALEERFENNTQSKVMDLHGKHQSLRKYNLSLSEYLLRAKTIANHLASNCEIILEKGLVLYILNGIGPKYLSFIKSFKMEQTMPSVGVLHNLLENYERVITTNKNHDSKSIFQENVTNLIRNIKYKNSSYFTCEGSGNYSSNKHGFGK